MERGLASDGWSAPQCFVGLLGYISMQWNLFPVSLIPFFSAVLSKVMLLGRDLF